VLFAGERATFAVRAWGSANRGSLAGSNLIVTAVIDEKDVVPEMVAGEDPGRIDCIPGCVPEPEALRPFGPGPRSNED